MCVFDQICFVFVAVTCNTLKFTGISSLLITYIYSTLLGAPTVRYSFPLYFAKMKWKEFHIENERQITNGGKKEIEKMRFMNFTTMCPHLNRLPSWYFPFTAIDRTIKCKRYRKKIEIIKKELWKVFRAKRKNRPQCELLKLIL